MHDQLHPILHKAAVSSLAVNVARTGLSIGDTAELHLMEDDSIGVFAERRRRLFGVFPRKSLLFLGLLDAAATATLTPALHQGGHLRIRIVGLTPEHLSPTGIPEAYVSVWGEQRQLPKRREPTPLPST